MASGTGTGTENLTGTRTIAKTFAVACNRDVDANMTGTVNPTDATLSPLHRRRACLGRGRVRGVGRNLRPYPSRNDVHSDGRINFKDLIGVKRQLGGPSR